MKFIETGPEFRDKKLQKNKIPLKPCPFCGHEAFMDRHNCRGNTWHWVYCGNCLVETRKFGEIEAAEKIWNVRISPATPVAPVPPADEVDVVGGAGLSAVAEC